MMRHLLRSSFGLLCGALLLAGAAGCKKTEAKAEEEEHQVAPVKVVPAERKKLAEYTELLGGTQPLPQHSARVTAPVEGHVLSVLGGEGGKPLEEGQHVEKEQVIVRLDDRVVRANRAKTEAMLEDLQQQKEQADIAVRLARLDRDRVERMSPGDGSIPLVSRLEADKARLAYKDAESKQRAVGAKERALRAELEALDVQLGYYRLRAPIAGILSTVQAVPGQTLAIGTSVAEVIDLSEIDVVCAAPPAAAARLALGQPAWLAGEPSAGEHAEESRESGPAGKVVFIAVQAQPETGNFLVKVRFPNPDQRLRANMVTRVRVRTRHEKEVLTIPESALMEDASGASVVVVEKVEKKKNEKGEEEEFGTARKLRATLGVRDHEQGLVEVVGLEEEKEDHTKVKVPLDGLLFITEGGHGLEKGDTVKLEKEEEKHDEKEGDKGKEDKEKEDKGKDEPAKEKAGDDKGEKGEK